MPEAGEWITASQAARMLGVSLNKVSRMIKRGALETRAHPLDARIRLVRLSQVRQMLKDIEEIEGKGPLDGR